MPTTLRLLFLLMLGFFGLQWVGYGYDAPNVFVSGAQNIVVTNPESQAATVESAASEPLNFNRGGGALDKQADTPELVNFVAAESAAPRTIGQIIGDASPDSMIHLTPASAESFASGVDSGTYWARLGDVSHMTVPEYQVGVVGPGAAASLGEPVSGFMVSPAGNGSFMWEGAYNAAGVMEHTNTGLLSGGWYAPLR